MHIDTRLTPPPLRKGRAILVISFTQVHETYWGRGQFEIGNVNTLLQSLIIVQIRDLPHVSKELKVDIRQGSVRIYSSV